MATAEFKFIDGTTLKFEKFAPDTTYALNVTQPTKKPGQYVSDAVVYVPQEFHAFANTVIRNHNSYGYRRNPAPDTNSDARLKQPTVAITYATLSIGIPAGVYVPIRYNKVTNKFEIITQELTNDELILSSVAPPSLVAEVEKLKKAKEAEEIPEDVGEGEVELDEDAEVPA